MRIILDAFHTFNLKNPGRKQKYDGHAGIGDAANPGVLRTLRRQGVTLKILSENFDMSAHMISDSILEMYMEHEMFMRAAMKRGVSRGVAETAISRVKQDEFHDDYKGRYFAIKFIKNNKKHMIKNIRAGIKKCRTLKNAIDEMPHMMNDYTINEYVEKRIMPEIQKMREEAR